MAYRIISPKWSFVQFTVSDNTTSCAGENINICLPVFEAADISFQFVIEGDSKAEVDSLCDLVNSVVKIGTREKCTDALTIFSSKSERYRLSDLQVLYNWQHGIQTLNSIHIGECFHIGVDVGAQSFCSNCLQRIGDDCYTSVVEFGNDENAFGFNYCNSGEAVSETETDCSPTIITFVNQSNLTVPYTALLVSKYGPLPTIQVWIYNPDGILQDMGITAKLDTYPPTELIFDFGGNASGVIKVL